MTNRKVYEFLEPTDMVQEGDEFYGENQIWTPVKFPPWPCRTALIRRQITRQVFVSSVQQSAPIAQYMGDKDFDEMLEVCRGILGTKGADYTNGSTDRLANFKVAGSFLQQDPAKVLAVYLYKHVAAVFNYIRTGGQSESEPIKFRIADCINYYLLLWKLIQDKTVPVIPIADTKA